MSELAPEYWENQAVIVSRSSLDSVRASATAWAATTTSLLGVFGVVAVAKGPDTIDKVGPDVRAWVVLLIVTGVISLFVSLLTTARASRGIPGRFSPLTGLKLAKWHQDESRKALGFLVAGKVSGIIAAVAVTVAGLLALVNAASQTGKTTTDISILAQTQNGQVRCGLLVRNGRALVLEDSVTHELVLKLDRGISNVSVIDKCP